MSVALPSARPRSAINPLALLRRIPATAWLLLGLVVLAYGLWLPVLGFFGDDWSYVYYYHLLGPTGPGEFAAIDRPLSGWFYTITTVLFGEAAWPYHVFLLLLRWASAVLFWWVLKLVWPNQERGAVVAAALLAVYPGFRQTPIAVEFILHFFVLDLFLLSLVASLLAVNEGNTRRFWLLALIAAGGAAGTFSLEYFVGLEALRPVFLWLVARRNGLRGKHLYWAVGKAWISALVAVLGFVFWRVFVFRFPGYEPVMLEELLSSPRQGIVHLVKNVAWGLAVSLPGAWRQVFDFAAAGAVFLPYIAVLIVAFALAAFILWKQETAYSNSDTGPMPFWGAVMFGLGLVAMVVGGAPFWVTGIPITLDFPWDRPTLSLMPGASLALAGLLDMLPSRRVRTVVVGALLALAVGMHFINGAEYYREWQKLQSFTWQLAWRAPGLKPGTLLMFDVIPLNRYSDNDLTSLLNWTYAPEHRSAHIPYKYFDLTLRLDEEHIGLPGVEKGLPVQHDQRGTFFKTTTSETLALHYAPPECLKVLAPDDADWPNLPERLVRVLPMTDLNQIVPNGASQPPAVLGAEPVHDWCYFFQKADLARQTGDWQTIGNLGDQAFAAGLQPFAPVELLPFIEGYAHLEQWERAAELARTTAADEAARPALCRMWQRLQAATQADEDFTAIFAVCP